MITFEDISKKYQYVAEHMRFCRDAALNDEFPTHTTWIHPPTLARWLYGSISAFASEYISAVYTLEFKSLTNYEAEQVNKWAVDLSERLRKYGSEISKKYPEIVGELRI